MASTLRDLLIQRAARLQGRPALTAPGWGTLSYAQLRNRAEGVALGFLAGPPPAGVFSATGGPWDWMAELAAAAAGLLWEPTAPALSTAFLGGPAFNLEGGRGPYHDREALVMATTPFQPGLPQGELLARLRRLNGQLGWDHDTRVELPLARLAEPALRGALWSALYAGAHAVLVEMPPPSTGWFAGRTGPALTWAPTPFMDLLG